MTPETPPISDVPDLLLERYRLGEVTGAERVVVRRRLADDPALRARLAAIEDSDLQIELAEIPQVLSRGVRRRVSMPPTSASRTRWSWRFAPAAAAAIVVVGLGAHLWNRPVPPPSTTDVTTAAAEGDRIKGAALQVFRKTRTGSESLGDGDAVRPGDVVRLGYRGVPPGVYGAIVSVDGRGVVTTHVPAGGSTAAMLDRAGHALLEQAYELDDAPRYEVFYLVTGPKPFVLEPVIEAVRQTAARASRGLPGALNLRSGLAQSRFALIKEVPQ